MYIQKAHTSGGTLSNGDYQKKERYSVMLVGIVRQVIIKQHPQFCIIIIIYFL